MRIYKTTKKEVQEVTDICCDLCGRSCIGECGNFCGISFNVSGGYDSPIFPDDEGIRHYDICEYCTYTWMKTWSKDYLCMGTDANSDS